MNAIELAAPVKAKYDITWIIENVRRACALAAYYGNTHIRALADVDGQARLEGVKALLQAKEQFAGILDIQVCAFAQNGLIREPGAETLLREAMTLGADMGVVTDPHTGPLHARVRDRSTIFPFHSLRSVI